jgi:hypothetical protein
MSILNDPNNSAPEVSPDDSWGDDEGLVSVVLPARRKLGESSVLNTAHSATEPSLGLRIDSPVGSQAAGPTETTEPARRLEVKEFDGSILRLEESEMVPASEKVPRQVTGFQARPRHAAGAKTGEGRDWGMAHRHRLPWLLGGGALVTTSVLCGMVMLPKINAPNVPSKGSAKIMLVVEDEIEIEGMDALNALLARRGEALEIFRRFALASHVEEVVPLILDGNSLRETLGQHWQPQNFPRDWKPDTNLSWKILESSRRSYVLLEGDFPDHRKFSAYFTHRGPLPLLLLDWKATTAFGTASFDELEAGGGDPAEIRGVLSIADYYSTSWPEAEYQSYRLVSPDEQTIIWCYTCREGEPHATLAPLLKRGEITREANQSQKITARLERGPDDAAPNQWLIRELIQIDWITPKSDTL